MSRFFGLLVLLVGVIWLIEHYINTDIPLVPIIIIIIGLYLLLKPCCWKDKNWQDKKKR